MKEKWVNVFQEELEMNYLNDEEFHSMTIQMDKVVMNNFEDNTMKNFAIDVEYFRNNARQTMIIHSLI